MNYQTAKDHDNKYAVVTYLFLPSETENITVVDAAHKNGVVEDMRRTYGSRATVEVIPLDRSSEENPSKAWKQHIDSWGFRI